MNLKKNILKNFISLLIATISTRLVTLVIVVLIARNLGKNNFGVYSAAQAFVGLFAILFGFGMESGFVYKGTKEKNTIKWFLGTGILLKLIFGVAVLFVMLAVAKLLGYSKIHQNVILIFSFIFLFGSYQSFFSSIFQIHQRMEFKAILDVGRELLFLLFLIPVLTINIGIYGAAGAELLSNILFLILAYRLALIFVKPDFKQIKITEVFKNSYLFAFAGLFAIVYFQIDTVMLSLMRTAAETGIYSAAYKLPVATFLIPGVLSIVTLPAMYESEINNRSVLAKIYFLRTKYLVITGLLLGVSIWFLRKQIVLLIYGANFTQSADVLSILAWYIPLRFVSFVSGDIITTMGKQNIRTIIQAFTATTNVILNIILIPKYGIFGAAWATLGSELFLLSSYTFIASKLFVRLPTIETFVKPLLASIGMLAAIFLFKTHWTINYAVGFGLYWLILIAAGSFQNDPIITAVKSKFLKS